MAKIMIPEIGRPETVGDKPIIEDEPKTLNFLDAIAQGATDCQARTVTSSSFVTCGCIKPTSQVDSMIRSSRST